MIGAKVRTGVDFRVYPGVVLGEPGRGSADAAAFPVFGDHVTIGAHAVVLGGITVGHGSVVGANSVVTKDVPDNVVVAGSPARIIRHLLPFEEDWTRSVPAPAPAQAE
jgi:serine acetyltransferase